MESCLQTCKANFLTNPCLSVRDFFLSAAHVLTNSLEKCSTGEACRGKAGETVSISEAYK